MPNRPSRGKPNRLHRPSPDQSKIEAETLTLNQLANFATDLLQQSRAHFGVVLELIQKVLHISSGQAVASDLDSTLLRNASNKAF